MSDGHTVVTRCRNVLGPAAGWLALAVLPHDARAQTPAPTQTPPSTTIVACNGSGEDAYLALSYVPQAGVTARRPVTESDWRNQGWFRAQPRECVQLARTANAVFYVFALSAGRRTLDILEGPTAESWNRPSQSCITFPGPFASRRSACREGELAFFRGIKAAAPGRTAFMILPYRDAEEPDPGPYHEVAVSNPVAHPNPPAAAGLLGAQVQDLTTESAARLGRDSPLGALVVGVVPGGPAATAGLRAGDLIVAFDFQDVYNAQDLISKVSVRGAGTGVLVSYVRDGKRNPTIVTLGERPRAP